MITHPFYFKFIENCLVLILILLIHTFPRFASSVLLTFWWMNLCITPFALSVHCYSELTSCLRLLPFGCCCFGLWILLSSLRIFLPFPWLIPVVWPLPALTPPKPMFLSSKVFLLTSTPLIPGVCVQCFSHQSLTAPVDPFVEPTVHKLCLQSSPWIAVLPLNFFAKNL